MGRRSADLWRCGVPARCAARRRGQDAAVHFGKERPVALWHRRAVAVCWPLLAQRHTGTDPAQPGLPGLQRGALRQARGLSSGSGNPARPGQVRLGRCAAARGCIMIPVAALRLPLSTDLTGFISLLQRLGVPHRVSEEAGEQVLWVPDAGQLAEDVRHLYARFPEGDDTYQLPPGAAIIEVKRPGFMQQLRASPMTALVLLATLIVACFTLLGDDLDTLRWLTFLDFQVQGDYAMFTPLADSLAAGQWWRIFSPMLIHFGILHLSMNGLWYWELGRRIELRQGRWHLLGLTLLFAAVSNSVQYVFGGPSLFGGLSGVLYGLLGHCWIFQLLAPNPVYRMPRGVLIMMLVWLVLCLSGLVSMLGFGEIANGAHVGGLIIGCVTGLLGGAIARRRT
ncbi:Rhomboid protein [Pseudomonas cichorii]|uniref:Rhomboid protein n=2 Tax=Pseudomonas cichorii TaxID=36746 RepID=A0A3M4LTI7_PSECI|nr:Rhomboid protein [Pseudomonas cichorii]